MVFCDVKPGLAGIEAAADERILPIDIWGSPSSRACSIRAIASTSGLRRYPTTDVSPKASRWKAGCRSLPDPQRRRNVSRQAVLPAEEDKNDRQRGNERIISVAVKLQPDGNFEPSCRRLFEAVAQKRIMAVLLYPTGQGPIDLTGG